MERCGARSKTISGNRNARIECDEEGNCTACSTRSNSLVSVLNAHAENEQTLQTVYEGYHFDISHQLKTPLAALNIFNGIIQADDAQTIREFASLSEQELDRIETLVQNLLKSQKLDAGTIVIEKGGAQHIRNDGQDRKHSLLIEQRRRGKS